MATSTSPRAEIYTCVRRQWILWFVILVLLLPQVIPARPHPVWQLAVHIITVLFIMSWFPHRVSLTDVGIELRGCFRRQLLPFVDITSIVSRPGFGRHDVLLTGRSDPRWKLVVRSSQGRAIVIWQTKTRVACWCAALEAATGYAAERRS